jgi:hypothetical protein
LLVRAHRRVAFLVAERQQARASGNVSREQAIAAELNLLAPKQ